MSLERLLAVVTTLAALGALYFAWRTVVEARAAAKEARHDQKARRLETMIGLASQIRLSNRNANRVLSETYQDRLRPLAAVMDDELPRTFELSERRFTSAEYEVDEGLANASLDELREAVRKLAASD
jgi:hypothetical protein